jgi:hypothetical protein
MNRHQSFAGAPAPPAALPTDGRPRAPSLSDQNAYNALARGAPPPPPPQPPQPSISLPPPAPLPVGLPPDQSLAEPAYGRPAAQPESLYGRAPVGPRIWTGTHFLPRFIGEQYVPAEGPCYFYDDGTHCKTIIDGEAVNPYWGVTKAGKPRKRLAVACLTCREKKIKCDPDYPQCLQCEKAGRECRFKNASVSSRAFPCAPLPNLPVDSPCLRSVFLFAPSLVRGAFR